MENTGGTWSVIDNFLTRHRRDSTIAPHNAATFTNTVDNIMKNVVIAGYARSPFAPAFKGALACVRPDDLAAQVVKAMVHEK